MSTPGKAKDFNQTRFFEAHVQSICANNRTVAQVKSSLVSAHPLGLSEIQNVVEGEGNNMIVCRVAHKIGTDRKDGADYFGNNWRDDDPHRYLVMKKDNTLGTVKSESGLKAGYQRCEHGVWFAPVRTSHGVLKKHLRDEHGLTHEGWLESINITVVEQSGDVLDMLHNAKQKQEAAKNGEDPSVPRAADAAPDPTRQPVTTMEKLEAHCKTHARRGDCYSRYDDASERSLYKGKHGIANSSGKMQDAMVWAANKVMRKIRAACRNQYVSLVFDGGKTHDVKTLALVIVTPTGAFVVDMPRVENQTAVNIAACVQNVADLISSAEGTLVSLCADNASAPQKAIVETLKLKEFAHVLHTPCACHFLNLVGKELEGCELMKNAIACADKIREILTEAQKKKRPKKTIKIPVPVETRWWSMMRTLDFINEKWFPIQSACGGPQPAELHTAIAECVQKYSCLRDASRVLERQTACMYDTVRIVYELTTVDSELCKFIDKKWSDLCSETLDYAVLVLCSPSFNLPTVVDTFSASLPKHAEGDDVPENVLFKMAQQVFRKIGAIEADLLKKKSYHSGSQIPAQVKLWLTGNMAQKREGKYNPDLPLLENWRNIFVPNTETLKPSVEDHCFEVIRDVSIRGLAATASEALAEIAFSRQNVAHTSLRNRLHPNLLRAEVVVGFAAAQEERMRKLLAKEKEEQRKEAELREKEAKEASDPARALNVDDDEEEEEEPKDEQSAEEPEPIPFAGFNEATMCPSSAACAWVLRHRLQYLFFGLCSQYDEARAEAQKQKKRPLEPLQIMLRENKRWVQHTFESIHRTRRVITIEARGVSKEVDACSWRWAPKDWKRAVRSAADEANQVEATALTRSVEGGTLAARALEVDFAPAEAPDIPRPSGAVLALPLTGEVLEYAERLADYAIQNPQCADYCETRFREHCPHHSFEEYLRIKETRDPDFNSGSGEELHEKRRRGE